MFTKFIKQIIIFFVFSCSHAFADVPNSIARVLDVLFDEYNSVYFENMGKEISPELLEKAGLIEVFRTEDEKEAYVVYSENKSEEFLVYYFHNGTFLFVLNQNFDIGFDELFSKISRAETAYFEDKSRPALFITKGSIPPKLIDISYMESDRVTFDIHFQPSFGKPIYNYAANIVGDLAQYRGLVSDSIVLSSLGLTELDQNTFYRKFDDNSEITVNILEEIIAISMTRVQVDDLRSHLKYRFSGDLSLTFIPNMLDDKMQIVNDRNSVMISVLYDVRGEYMDIRPMPGLISGIRLRFNSRLEK